MQKPTAGSRVTLFTGYANLGIGIVNNRRLLAGKKPW